jgi:hypothetical protein
MHGRVLSEDYCCAEEELKKKSIRLSLHWEWRFKNVLESVAALDSARADALQLLRADETDDTTRMIPQMPSNLAEVFALLHRRQRWHLQKLDRIRQEVRNH